MTDRYRKKPVVIEAKQATGTPESNREIIDWTRGSATPASMGDHPERGKCLSISTLEGAHWVSPGDWIIKGVAGEFYPCKPDIFAATYEPVETTLAASATPRTEPRSTHRVHRGNEWLPCYCAADLDHKVGHEQERVEPRGIVEAEQQEPVAWMVYTLDGKSVCVTDNPADFTDEHRALPLYTEPFPTDEALLRQALEALGQIARDLPWELTGLQADTIAALRKRLGEGEG